MKTQMYSITTPPTLNKFDFPLAKNEKLSLLEMVKAVYYRLVIAKSMTEPENSNNLYTADSSTPLNRAFFVRSSRTPKERLETLRGSECPYELGMSVFGHTQILSMVACNGKGSPFAVFRVSQFLSPLHAIAQTLRSLAVAPKRLNTELSAMIYLFLCSDRYAEQYSEKVVRVQADTEQQAQYNLTAQYRPLMLVTKAPDDKSDYINAKLAKFKANRMGVVYA